jgi:hypothetical protein
MILSDPAAPRWPTVRAGRGHYESYYLRAVHPTRPLGVWIRYTVTTPPGGEPAGQLWFTLFDREAGPPRKVRVDTGPPGTGDGAWIRLGDSVFGDSGSSGDARSARCAASWSLRSSADQPALRHLPRDWMYTARLPRTKLLSLTPAAVFDGTLEVDGTAIDVTGWPGMVGHNWGEQHADSWIWLHGLGFEDRGSDTWLDLAVGRIAVGPITTPWVANGVLSLDGERIVLGGLRRRAAVLADDDSCVLRLTGTDATVTATAAAPADAFAAWDYAGPAGPDHRVVNCSVADLSVCVERPGAEPVRLAAPARAVYELGRH